MKLAVNQVINLSEGNFLLNLDNSDQDIKFTPGQHFTLSLPKLGINREYSVASSPDCNYLEFFIREIKDGIVSSALRKLNIGDYVDVTGPFGEFVIRNNDIKKKKLFIASGTGLAPFKSFIESYQDLNYKIIHGVRYSYDLLNKFASGSVIPCISREDTSRYKRVTEFLANENLELYDEFFLCGNKNMISDSIEILIKKKINSSKVYIETFF